MRWMDRHGRALPLDAIFAVFQLRAQRRAALALGRVIQRRQQRAANDIGVVITKTAQGTTIREDPQ